MNDIITKPLILKKKSKSSRFASWGGEGNLFMDKFLRSLYIFLLFAINFVMFIYSINAKMVENGVVNQAVLAILGSFFVVSFFLVMFFSFSKKMQNGICALFTMIFVAIFFYQFALFDVDNFVEEWLSKKASWLSFICLVPSAWLVGLFIGIIIFFLFWSRFGLMFITAVLMIGFLLGINKNESIKNIKNEYSVVKKMPSAIKNRREDVVVYFMVPKFPSYQFLSSVRNTHFRELRNLMIGFFASNEFEIYPNAFVEYDDSAYNVIDIFNQVDYSSATSKNRGFSEYINDWNFIHGGLNILGLEENKLYDYMNKRGYGFSVYPMPGFNTCMVGGDFETGRCVIKGYKTVRLYDKNASLEENIYTLLTEWMLNLKRRDLKKIALKFSEQSTIKDLKVTSENRRVSIEGAPKLFDVLSENYLSDSGAQAYMVYVDIPSDVYIYDEYCNLKPRSEWIALKDNSLNSGGIDEKRKAYVEQSKCLIGKMQEFLDMAEDSGKLSKTDVVLQGVSSIRELADMTGGRYGNFVTNKLVAMGIRKAKNPKFLINANICLASDFSKSLIRYQDYCYSVDNMKMDEKDATNLKKNLINNSVIRGGKITSIIVNYNDWYEEFKNNSNDYQEKIKKKKEKKLKQEEAERDRIERERKKKEREDAYRNVGKKNISQDNIFVPTDEEIVEVEHEELEKVNKESLQKDDNKQVSDEVNEIVEVVETLEKTTGKDLDNEVNKITDNVAETKFDEELEKVHNESLQKDDNKQVSDEVNEIIEVVETLEKTKGKVLHKEVNKITDNVVEIIEIIEEGNNVGVVNGSVNTAEAIENNKEAVIVDEALKVMTETVSKEDVKTIIEIVGEDDEGVKLIKEQLNEDDNADVKTVENKLIEEMENNAKINNTQQDIQDYEEEIELELDF